MKRTLSTLVVLFLISGTLLVGGCFFLARLIGPPDVTVHAAVLPRDREFYSDAVLATNPELNAYCYNLDTYISIPNLDSSTVNVANEEGQVPVFRFDDSIFVVLHKGRNYSRGLAICEDATEMANKYRQIEFKKLETGLYYWEHDGQRSLRDPDLYNHDVVLPK